jgi:hypothetical protein
LSKDKDPTAARAALLHEFPWNKVSLYENKFPGNKQDFRFVLDHVATNPLQEEDLIIHLADSTADKNGIVTHEQRVAGFENRQSHECQFRNKIIKMPIELLQPYIELKQYFDKKLGMNIYYLFFKSK